MKEYRIQERNGKYRAQKYHNGLLFKGWSNLNIQIHIMEDEYRLVEEFETIEEVRDLIQDDKNITNGSWQTIEEY